MTLRELVNTIEFDEVFSVLQREWNVEDKTDSYRGAYDLLRTIRQSEKSLDEIIKVEWCCGDNPYLMADNVCGCAWEDNVNKQVVTDGEISLAEAAAACLWEQTFWGYSPDMQERRLQFMVEDTEYQIAHGLTTTIDPKEWQRLLDDDFHPFDQVEEAKWKQWREQRMRELKLA